MKLFLVVVVLIAVATLTYRTFESQMRQTEPTAMAAPMATVAFDDITEAKSMIELSGSMTAMDVLEQLGSPMSVDADGRQWTYEDRIVVFRDERVIGWVDTDGAEPATAIAAGPRADEPQWAAPGQRPTHVSSTHQNDGGIQVRVVYGNTMGRHASGPYVYGSTGLGGRQNARATRGHNGFRDLARSEYGRPAGRRLEVR
jgi:hypothetical protein